ncbi:MAG: bifunctional oligoribonuclease/PAP phosphatase NrnA [Bacteroidales bacterium]|nr:bifunctional oligoribonuclease/PAP phosphatase NrnA [Bacteroidales bacterium]
MAKEKKDIITDIIDEINKKDPVLIISHYNPDGDAIGSSLALYLLLKKLGKNVDVIIPDQVPHYLSWMKGGKEIIIYNSDNYKCEQVLKMCKLIIAVDFNSLERVNNIGKLIENHSCKKILIDHHPDPKNFADITFSDVSVSSCAEIVYEIIYNSSFKKLIDTEIATCIYTGIMTDTVNFRHNISKRTFEILSELVEKNINIPEININTYDLFSFHRLRLLGYSLEKKMTYIPEFNTAYISLTQNELKEFNHIPGDTENFVNYPLSIKNVKFSALFIERPDEIKISFRSKNNFKVNEFAKKHFNGGGHNNASGGKSFESLNNTVKKFTDLLSSYKNELSG